MRYQIIHTTTYKYSQPVALDPHLIRLRSRCDVTQTLQSFALNIFPEPSGISPIIDLEGNQITRVWFKDRTEELKIDVQSEVETHRTNPFDYLLEPWATKLPIDYPSSLVSKLHFYFQPYATPTPIDPVALNLAQEISQAVDGNTTAFLSQLNEHIHQHCKHTIRENGPPLPPATTWNQKIGSCRDLTVLFMEACRAVGLAARFVSGYQQGNPNRQRRYLHAWAEVYLPGAGWRGYDPTQGLAVSDRHIALVASAIPRHTSPIYGIFRGAGVESFMTVQLSIKPLDETNYTALNLTHATESEIRTALQAQNLNDKKVTAVLHAIRYWKESEQQLTWENLERSTQSGKDKVKGFSPKIYQILQDIAIL